MGDVLHGVDCAKYKNKKEDKALFLTNHSFHFVLSDQLYVGFSGVCEGVSVHASWGGS